MEHICAQEKWDEIAAVIWEQYQAILSQKIVYQYQAFAQAILSSIQRTEKYHLSRGHHTEKCIQYTYVS